MNSKTILFSFIVLATVCCAQTQNQTRATEAKQAAASKPKVRAITGFVRLERSNYVRQIADTLAVLRRAKAAFEAEHYEVQSVRITTQPLAELVAGASDEEAMGFLKELDALSSKEDFAANIGPGMVKDGDDPRTMRLLERVLSTLPNLNASAVIAGQEGIHWKVIRESAALVHYVAQHSPRSQGNFNFAVIAMVPPHAPFYPGSYHMGAGRQFAIGFEGANVVAEVFARTHEPQAAAAALAGALTVHAAAAERVGTKVATATGWTYMGVDPTPAPLGDVSIGEAIESYKGAKFGSSGTMTAASIITAAVKEVPVKQVGYSGLMVPVMEDKLLAQRWAEGMYSIDSLLAYSAVCATGLDTVPLPGDTTPEQIERIFGDVATLAVKWNKPLAARLLPVRGKRAGERTEFKDQFLFNTMLHKVP